MKLSKHDADQFFELMIPLQFFVNQRLKIKPDIVRLEQCQTLSHEQRLPLRDAVYQHPELIDEFIKENPQNFTAEQLDIIMGWKHPVVGDFFIERLLKKYAVFIRDKDVYAVLALHDGFDELFHPSALPVYVKAVLLPYQGKIVYDGIIQSYNVFFGGGIKGNLKEDYLSAKQNGRIIETLGTESVTLLPARSHKPGKDWGPELEKLTARIAKLRSSANEPPVLGPAFRLLKSSAEMARLANAHPDDLDALWKQLRKAMNAVNQIEKTLYRAED